MPKPVTHWKVFVEWKDGLGGVHRFDSEEQALEYAEQLKKRMPPITGVRDVRVLKITVEKVW